LPSVGMFLISVQKASYLERVVLFQLGDE